MNIAVMGTGMVGRAISSRLYELGHKVVIGTRDVNTTMTRDEVDMAGNPPFSVWYKSYPEVELVDFSEAARQSEIIVNATNGSAAVSALNAAGKDNLRGKNIIDVSNPLDFSSGMTPQLLVKDDDSLGEQIQRAFPQSNVVKTLNTMNAHIMVRPGQLEAGEHTVFLSGNDENAKAQTAELLRSFGWTDIFDLGDISSARGPEMYFRLWLLIFMKLEQVPFNIKVVRKVQDV
ncbi:MAG: NAD(P)-binding domain-containing protein [Chloroflexota bacterium]